MTCGATIAALLGDVALVAADTEDDQIVPSNGWEPHTRTISSA